LAHSKGYSKYNYISKKLSNPADRLEIPVYCLLKTKFSGFWIGSQDACLFQLEGSYRKQYCPNLSNPESIKSKSISCLFEDESGILWIGTSDQGLFKMDPHAQFFKTHRLQNENHEYVTNPNVTAILEDGQKTLWIGSDKGLFSAKNGSEIFKSWTYEQRVLTKVTSISSSKDEILIGCKEGLFLIKANKISKIQFQKPLLKEEVSSLAIDENENVWIGTSMAGVCLWKRNEKTFPGKKIYNIPHKN
jgi:ligand-binding sensor domain-containing protein